MTTPKKNPEGITSWIEIEYRFQGGSKLHFWGHVSIIEESKKFFDEPPLFLPRILWLKHLSHSCFWYIDNFSPLKNSRVISKKGISPNNTTKQDAGNIVKIRRVNMELVNHIFVMSASVGYNEKKCLTWVELRKGLLREKFPKGFDSWKGKLSDANATRNTRDLLAMARLDWLPKGIRKSEIIEVRPPYGSVKLLSMTIPFLLEHKRKNVEKLLRHHPTVRMFIQLPQGYEEPPKRRRGRPLKST